MATYSNNTTLKVNTQNTLTTTLGSIATTTVLTTAANQYYEVEFSIVGSAAGSACNILINGVVVGSFGGGIGNQRVSSVAGLSTFSGKRIMLGPSSTLAIQVLATNITWSHHATMFINTP